MSMILPQVHLRKPCYDFFFLEVDRFDNLPRPDKSSQVQVSHRTTHSVEATGGVYKEQGRNQYSLMNCTY